MGFARYLRRRTADDCRCCYYDGGKSWAITPLFTAKKSIYESYTNRGQLNFVDDLHGWMQLGITSSSAMSAAYLFKTSDGGRTWTALPLPPIGGKIHFFPDGTGWQSGGVLQNELCHTKDWGMTWTQVVPLPGDVKPWINFYAGSGTDTSSEPVYIGPHFETEQKATIAIGINVEQYRTDYFDYATSDGGQTWTLQRRKPNKLYGIPVFFGSSIIEIENDFQGRLKLTDGPYSRSVALPAGVSKKAYPVATDFLDDGQYGWIALVENTLLGTTDGGETYSVLLKGIPPKPRIKDPRESQPPANPQSMSLQPDIRGAMAASS